VCVPFLELIDARYLTLCETHFHGLAVCEYFSIAMYFIIFMLLLVVPKCLNQFGIV
jgi:hypothetical protein